MINRVSQIISVLSFLLIVFITYTNEIDDLDFWWHLKDGQIIYETHTIPQKEYFSYTTEIPEHISRIGKNEVDLKELPSEDTSMYWASGLKGNWLSQLVFYLVYLVGGFKGIGILKSAVFALTYLVLYLAMLKRGAGHLSSFFILCLIAFIGTDFNYTRPQIFSFLFFPCILYVLYDFRQGGRSIYFLPALMIIWANLHGGFILGVLTILAFACAEFIKYFLRNRFGISENSCLQKRRLWELLLFSSGSSLASLINPNGYKAFLFPLYFEKSIFIFIEEYRAPMLYEYHAYWFMLALLAFSLLMLIKSKHLDLTELFISLIVTIPSLRGIRYIIFFALGTGVFLAYSMMRAGTGIKEWSPFRRFFDKTVFSTMNIKGFVSLLVAAGTLLFIAKISISGEVLQFDMRGKRYPSGAAAFIQDSGLTGNMFNLYNWGGYLVWHLYPDYRVFIYGRTINETAFFHYNQIVRAEGGNERDQPLWKRLLDAYGIDFIVTSAVASSGHIVPFVNMLYDDRGWELVYTDGKSMIFVKATPDNQDFIHRYYLSKEQIYDEIISECKQGIADTPATWGYYETLGYVYMKQNRLKEALSMFQRYLAMNPDNKKVRYSHDLLKRYLEKYNKTGNNAIFQ